MWVRTNTLFLVCPWSLIRRLHNSSNRSQLRWCLVNLEQVLIYKCTVNGTVTFTILMIEPSLDNSTHVFECVVRTLCESRLVCRHVDHLKTADILAGNRSHLCSLGKGRIKHSCYKARRKRGHRCWHNRILHCLWCQRSQCVAIRLVNQYRYWNPAQSENRFQAPKAHCSRSFSWNNDVPL